MSLDAWAYGEMVASGECSVGEALLLLSEVLMGREDALEVGMGMLDEFVLEIDEPTNEALAATVLGRHGLSGDVENYHAEENSFLDLVLERRVGMPITLCGAVVEVALLRGRQLSMIGIPGHVIVGTEDPGIFIDAFGGAVVGIDWVRRRYQSIFGNGATLPTNALAPMTIEDTIIRVCNNLMRTWGEDRTGKIDALLDVRSRLRVTRADAEFLLPVAVARGQYDLAARFKYEIDPEDPGVGELWARLN